MSAGASTTGRGNLADAEETSSAATSTMDSTSVSATRQDGATLDPPSGGRMIEIAIGN
jgi:hypothetical protein